MQSPNLRDLEETPVVTEFFDEEYRRTHARDGHVLGSTEYPDNREGRRKLARTWRGHRTAARP